MGRGKEMGGGGVGGWARCNDEVGKSQTWGSQKARVTRLCRLLSLQRQSICHFLATSPTVKVRSPTVTES